ncbi:hypothetical protein T492DRAFT_982767 [Pavlovales sp. CCMP2436]|nr:hypothetical protein T492DRAFT_982767 [Pavlovales sp. CCMP2436]
MTMRARGVYGALFVISATTGRRSILLFKKKLKGFVVIDVVVHIINIVIGIRCACHCVF